MVDRGYVLDQSMLLELRSRKGVKVIEFCG